MYHNSLDALMQIEAAGTPEDATMPSSLLLMHLDVGLYTGRDLPPPDQAKANKQATRLFI
jgi:hypothetical protein